MDATLTLLLTAGTSSVMSVLGTLAVQRINRAESDRTQLILLRQEQTRSAERYGEMKVQLDKMLVDLNRLGGIVRELRMALKIAAATGEVPRLDGGDRSSGEVPRL